MNDQDDEETRNVMPTLRSQQEDPRHKQLDTSHQPTMSSSRQPMKPEEEEETAANFIDIEKLLQRQPTYRTQRGGNARHLQNLENCHKHLCSTPSLFIFFVFVLFLFFGGVTS